MIVYYNIQYFPTVYKYKLLIISWYVIMIVLLLDVI